MLDTGLLLDIATSHISFMVVALTVLVLYRFHSKAKKAGAAIWEHLGEGLLIAMSIVLIAQVFHMANAYLGEHEFRIILNLFPAAAYLIASLIVAVYIWKAIDDIREVMG